MSKLSLTRAGSRVWLATAVVVVTARPLLPSTSGVADPPHPTAATPPHWVEHLQASQPLKKNADPRLRCAAAMVVDNSAGAIVYARNAHDPRPIASLTKLLTALVFLESGTDLNGVGEVTPDDAKESSRSRLRPGERYVLRDVLYAALIASDNRAARVLSHSTGIPQARFVAVMNDKARSLGMDSTRVVEPTGLSTENISTAYDLAILVNAALQHPLIAQITSTPEYAIRPLNKTRLVRFNNTNRLLHSDLRLVGGKTGYIQAAGWCVAARAVSPDGGDFTAIVLGAPSSGQRFRSLANVLRWAFGLTPLSRHSFQGTLTPGIN